MNTVPNITPGSITGIQGLSKRPVFFLKIGPVLTPNLVVKGEAAGGSLPFATDDEATVSVKWGSKLMKNVNNPSVNSKIMTATEIAIFKQAAVASFPNGSPQWNNVAGGANYNWVKMPYVAGLSDAEYYDDNSNINISAIKKDIVTFSDEQVWKDLGKIVAVDIFNGNGDRFDITTGHWQNKGNVMFLQGGPTKVIGLDTFDPNSQQSNLAKTGTFDELKTLIDPARRKQFAEECCKSVGSELKRGLKGMGHITIATTAANGVGQIRKIAVDELPTLFLPFAPDFEAGLKAGADDLKNYLQRKVREYSAQLPPPPKNTPWQRATPNVNPTPPPVMPPQPPTPGHWQRAPPNKGPNMPPLPPTPNTPPTTGGTWQRATPSRPNMPPLPQIPNNLPPPPAPPTAAQAAQAPRLKTIPQGVIDRMNYLGWNI